MAERYRMFWGSRYDAELAFRIRLIVAFIALAIIGYVVFMNTGPFDEQITVSMHDGATKFRLEPSERFEYGSGGSATSRYERLYFLTKVPKSYERATVKMVFKPKNETQTMKLGFNDDTDWHFNTKSVYVPYLQNLQSTDIGSTGLKLYNPKVDSTESLGAVLKAANAQQQTTGLDSGVAVPDKYIQSLPGYQAGKAETTLNVPLRGSVTFYAYVAGEYFNLRVLKQDLNWYEDADPVKVSIYKNEKLVYSDRLEDDGNATDDKKVGPVQEYTIKNPSSNYPEPGVYKVVLSADSDVIFKRITTNLHKIVFEGPLYVAGNSGLYNLKKSTSPLFFVGSNLQAKIQHAQSAQTVKVNGGQVQLKTVNTDNALTADPISNVYEVTPPKGDIILNGTGLFAFTNDQSYNPFTYAVYPVVNKSDLQHVDQLVSGYRQVMSQGGWLTTEVSYDLATSYLDRNLLRWQITAPGEPGKEQTLTIKDIQVTYFKHGWLSERMKR